MNRAQLSVRAIVAQTLYARTATHVRLSGHVGLHGLLTLALNAAPRSDARAVERQKAARSQLTGVAEQWDKVTALLNGGPQS